MYTPPDIIWTPAGLDSNMVISLYKTSDGYIFAGTNYGLFVSADSSYVWNLVNQEISSSVVTCFADYPGDIILAGTAGKGFFISSDKGNNWTQSGPQGININAIAATKEGKIFLATQNEGLLTAESLTDSWRSVNTGSASLNFASLLITGNNKIFAGGTGVYRSDDNGTNWILKNKGLGNWYVLALIVDSSGHIDAGTDNGGFFTTNDYGESWLKFNNGLTNTEITTLIVNNQGHIFAGTWRGGIFRTLDGGMNWAPADSGLTIRMVNTLTCYNDIMYAGTFKGLFRTSSVTTSH